MDEIGDKELELNRGRSSSSDYSTAYIVINAVCYAMAGAYIGWRYWSVLGGTVGAILGLFLSVYLVGMTYDNMPATSKTKLFENLGISVGFALGIALGSESSYIFEITQWLLRAVMVFAGGILGMIAGSLVTSSFTRVGSWLINVSRSDTN